MCDRLLIITSLILSLGLPVWLSAAPADLAVSPSARSHTQEIRGPEASFTIDVAGKTPPVNRSIEIAGPAEDIRIKIDGGLDFSSIKALAESLVKPGMTDEEKVKACFYFAVNNLYDRGAAGCDDPLEYISLWGHSYCGNFGLFVNALWKALGFPAVFLNPVIGLPSGHTISAVYYDNQWHMYDSRLRGYFLNWDNRTVASLVELDRDDNLIRRALDYDNRLHGHWDFPLIMVNYFNAASDWYDGYDAHFGNARLFNTDCPRWDPSVTLREGEKLTLNWTNAGKWWSRKDLSPRWLELHRREGREAMKVPPVIYANGTLEFRIDPRLYKSQAQEFSGIQASGGKNPVFEPAQTRKKGYIVYRVKVPYFIPSLRVEAAGFRKSPDDQLAIELSTDEGASWQPLWQAESTGNIKIDISTDQIQRVTMYSPNKYSCLLRFSLEPRGAVHDVSFSSIRLTADLFYRQHILPALKNGTNRIVYSDRSKGSYKKQVTFNWLEDTNILFSEDRPGEGDSVIVTALVRNNGDSPAQEVKVRFFDGDPEKGGVKIGGDQVIAVIAPGATEQVAVVWLPVQRQLDAGVGYSVSSGEKMTGYLHNTIYVQVDPENSIPESDETNNITSREVTVYNMANLILSHPSFITFDRSGDKVTISALVRNQNLWGLLPRAREACNVVVRFYDGQPMDGRLERGVIGQAVIPAIPAGEFGLARIEWDVKGLTGRHVVYVIADPEDKIPEKWQNGRRNYMLVKKEIVF